MMNGGGGGGIRVRVSVPARTFLGEVEDVVESEEVEEPVEDTEVQNKEEANLEDSRKLSQEKPVTNNSEPDNTNNSDIKLEFNMTKTHFYLVLGLLFIVMILIFFVVSCKLKVTPKSITAEIQSSISFIGESDNTNYNYQINSTNASEDETVVERSKKRIMGKSD
jgi:hypothetical protein